MRGHGEAWRLIQEHGAFGGGGQAAGVVFAEESVAKARHDSISQISQWPGDDPEQAAEEFPAASQRHQNSADGSGSQVSIAIANENECVETIANCLVQHSFSRRSLQRSESQRVFWITCQQPVHGVITQPAHAIKEDGWVIKVGLR